MADPIPGLASFGLLNELLGERADFDGAAEIAALKAELAAVTRERDLLRLQVERMQEAAFLDHQVRQNAHVKPERETIVALAREYESAIEAKKADADGFVRIRRRTLAANTGRDPRTISRDLGMVERLGLGDFKREDHQVDVGVDGDGVILTAPSTDIWFRPAIDARTMRKRASEVTAEERKAATGKVHTHGGAREIVVCPDHPTSPIRKEWRTYCGTCNKPLDKGEDKIKPPADAEGMDILSTNRKSSDRSPARCSVDDPLDKLSTPPAPMIPVEPAGWWPASTSITPLTDIAYGRDAP